MLEKIFKLKENKTNVKTEIIAGLTTFMAMAYILSVNPNILSAAGMSKASILFATAVASFIGCMVMGLLTNYPFALAPGLGLNAYFAYTICVKMGYSYEVALFAVLVEGVLFIILSLTGFREKLVKCIPTILKQGISVGLGLFIAFIGLQNAGIVVSDSATIIALLDFTNLENLSKSLGALLAIVALIITVVLSRLNIKGSVLLGILSSWAIGIVLELTGAYKVDVANGVYSMIPDFSNFSLASLTENVGACFNFSKLADVNILEFLVAVFALLYMDMFDTMGTLVGVCQNTGLCDENGNIAKSKQALLADAIATTTGAVLGTSTVTTFCESASGTSVGGRTGLTSIVTGILFLLSVFLYPIFTAIPSFATSAALIYVGFLMFKDVTKIKPADLIDSIPCFLIIIMMPLTYSISDGIAFGIISYVILNLVTGKFKKLNALLVILTVLFVLKYIFVAA